MQSYFEQKCKSWILTVADHGVLTTLERKEYRRLQQQLLFNQRNVLPLLVRFPTMNPAPQESNSAPDVYGLKKKPKSLNKECLNTEMIG